jgi:hypothetical protein
MRLTTGAIEGLKLDRGVTDKIVFDDDVSLFSACEAKLTA